MANVERHSGASEASGRREDGNCVANVDVDVNIVVSRASSVLASVSLAPLPEKEWKSNRYSSNNVLSLAGVAG